MKIVCVYYNMMVSNVHVTWSAYKGYESVNPDPSILLNDCRIIMLILIMMMMGNSPFGVCVCFFFFTIHTSMQGKQMRVCKVWLRVYVCVASEMALFYNWWHCLLTAPKPQIPIHYSSTNSKWEKTWEYW